MKHRIEKRTLEPGWAEVRIVLQRPDTEDFTAEGDKARFITMHFVLALAAGIATSIGFPNLAAACGAAWNAIAHDAGICDGSCGDKH